MSVSLQQRVRDALLAHGLRASSCVIGVSGGIDSMCLFDCCAKVAEDLALALSVVHVNYGLRGAESDADEQLVRDVCEKWGIPLHVVHARPYDEPHVAQHGLEATARNIRYRVFAEYAEAHAIPVVLTAHTLNDQAETVLMHLARGSGLRGLSGIPIRRALTPSVDVIRPLRDVTRDEILVYAQESGVPWREDASNQTDAFLRNRVRHIAMPALREALGAHVSEGITRSADHLRSIASFVDEHVRSAITETCDRTGALVSADLESLSQHHPAIASEVLRQGFDLTFDDLRRVLHLRAAQVGSSASITGNRRVVRERDTLVCVPQSEDAVVPSVVIHDDGQYVAGSQVLHVNRSAVCDVVPLGGPSTVCVDASSVVGHCVWRPWNHGDRFQPFGMTGHVLVSDLLTNARVPNHQRPSIRVLSDDDGVLWVCGIRQAERTRVTNRTTKVYIFHIEHFPTEA